MSVNYESILEEIKKQEAELQFTSFTNEDAAEIGFRLYETAKKENLPVTILKEYLNER